MEVIVVTWMDDKQEVYQCTRWQVSNGCVLVLHNQGATGQEKRILPLSNIRIFKVERD
jgi:hypothetical protein